MLTKVPVVDDDPEDVMLFRAAPRCAAGECVGPQYEVDSAATLARARALLETNRSDVLLLDFRLDCERGTDLLFGADTTRLPASIILCTRQDDFSLDHRTIQMISKGRLRFFPKSARGGERQLETVTGGTRQVVWTGSLLPGNDPPPAGFADDIATE